MYHTTQEQVDAQQPLTYIQKWNGKPYNFLSKVTYDVTWWLQETEQGRSYAPWTYEPEDSWNYTPSRCRLTLCPWVAEMYRDATSPLDFDCKVGAMIRDDVIRNAQEMLDVGAEYGVNFGTDLRAYGLTCLIERFANRHATSPSSTIWWNIVANALFSDLSKQDLLAHRDFIRA